MCPKPSDIDPKEERFTIFVDAVKDYAIFLLDDAGYVKTWNIGAERIKGYKADEIIGKHFSVFYSAELIAKGHPQYELEIASRCGRYEEEGKRIRKDGSEFWAWVTITALKDDSGEVTGFAKITRDITERKHAEEELRSAHADLEIKVAQRTADLLSTVEQLQNEIRERKRVEQELIQAKEVALAANEAKSAFLANMSHEIRTPLGAVLGFSELLHQPDLSDEERELYLDTLKRNSDVLLTIINDILDLSKVDSGTFHIHKTTVNLNDFIDDVAVFLGLKANEKGLELVINAEGHVPPSFESDPIRLKQILFNIIGNAIKFTERGSVTVTMKVVPSRQGNLQLAFDVTDTGPGIAPESAKNLFEPFVQVDPSFTRRYGGTGLGLALSRRLAQALGGDVFLKESTLGQGTTFTITVDAGRPPEKKLLYNSLKEKDRHSPQIVQSVPSQHDDDKTGERARILLVEDLPDNRLLIRTILNKLGIEVDLAENGRDGVEKALAGNYDIVLMDLQMPVMDGYEATQELRKLGFTKPIVALTAHSFKEDKNRAQETGFSDFLTKPISRQKLRRSLSTLSPKIRDANG